MISAVRNRRRAARAMLLTVLLVLACALTVVVVLPATASAAEPLVLDGFERTCLTEYLGNCKVSTAGYFTSEDGDRRFAWQTQTGFTPEHGVLGGIVLLAPLDGGWTIFGTGYRAYRYGTPLAIEDRLIHVAGKTGGSGGYNADLLYAWGENGPAADNENWHQIDIEDWNNTIANRLPPGLEILQGVSYDFGDWEYGLVARTPLWRPQDGSCCGSGGNAVIVFEIVAETLVVRDVIYTPPNGDE